MLSLQGGKKPYRNRMAAGSAAGYEFIEVRQSISHMAGYPVSQTQMKKLKSQHHVSEKRIEANRTNARKSTGPKSVQVSGSSGSGRIKSTTRLMQRRWSMPDIKPIRTEKDYDAALSEVERLWGAKLGTPEGDRLDVLATLIDSYERVHCPMDPPDPIEAIKFRMSQQKLTRKQLEPMIGTRTRVAEVLNRRRSLSISMIRRLHLMLGISAEVHSALPCRCRQKAPYCRLTTERRDASEHGGREWCKPDDALFEVHCRHQPVPVGEVCQTLNQFAPRRLRCRKRPCQRIRCWPRRSAERGDAAVPNQSWRKAFFARGSR
jgi:HTH-type transcriptional regulator / antitoxin HigA